MTTEERAKKLVEEWRDDERADAGWTPVLERNADLARRIAEMVEKAENNAWNHVHSYPDHDSFHNYGDCGGNHIDGCGFVKKEDR